MVLTIRIPCSGNSRNGSSVVSPLLAAASLGLLLATKTCSMGKPAQRVNELTSPAAARSFGMEAPKYKGAPFPPRHPSIALTRMKVLTSAMPKILNDATNIQ
jgi:hypothetical protein